MEEFKKKEEKFNDLVFCVNTYIVQVIEEFYKDSLITSSNLEFSGNKKNNCQLSNNQ